MIQDKEGKYSLNFLDLDEKQKGEIYISDFGGQNKSLIIIPSLQSKISASDGLELTYPISLTASILERTPSEEEELIKQLLAQIEELQKEIASVQLQISILKGESESNCTKFENNLFYGLLNDAAVHCLQQFLKRQGEKIYPEGLITGNFFDLTLAAVKRYQGSKGIVQTGYFGPLTRVAVNKDLGW